MYNFIYPEIFWLKRLQFHSMKKDFSIHTKKNIFSACIKLSENKNFC